MHYIDRVNEEVGKYKRTGDRQILAQYVQPQLVDLISENRPGQESWADKLLQAITTRAEKREPLLQPYRYMDERQLNKLNLEIIDDANYQRLRLDQDYARRNWEFNKRNNINAYITKYGITHPLPPLPKPAHENPADIRTKNWLRVMQHLTDEFTGLFRN